MRPTGRPTNSGRRGYPVASGRQQFPIISDGLPTQLPDIDPDETREWVESFDSVVRTRGRARARYVMLRLLERAREQQVGVPGLRSTDFINTIPPEREPWFPGDEHVERRIRAYIRWNAAVMVSRANRPGMGVGGHIATYASAASLYEVGFNHFFRGKDHGESGDQVFFQGHAAPGIYARAFLEGRLTEDQLNGFRQELSHPGGGLPSYPHPRLMPEFWEFPTVSMGLGALNSIYQARFNRYLLAREIHDTSRSHVWAFLGDGEMDEPEALGAIGLAAREELDNLTFVINCNLQRLDGPVRGNGKVIQELEAFFRGAGWNVIKVIWGRDWDTLLATGHRRRAGQQDEHHAGRAVPDVQRGVRGVHQGELLRRRPAAARHGGAPVRRRAAQPVPRRPRLPQGVRGVQGGAGAHRPAHGHPGAHDQGLDAGQGLRGAQRHAPDEEAHRGRAEGVPGPALPADLRRRAGSGAAAVLPPGRGLRRDPVHARAAGRARRGAPPPGSTGQAAAAAQRLGLRRAAQGLGQAGGGHHDGVRPAAQGADEGPDHRGAVRADHPGRGQDVRHGLAVPDGEDLLPARADLRGGGPQPAAVLQGVREGPDPARGHQRVRRDGLGDRRGHLVRHARHAHDPGVRVLLDVRLAADRGRDVGCSATSSGGASCSARPPAGPRWPARACSTTTGTRCCWPRSARRACPTTARGRSSWPT